MFVSVVKLGFKEWSKNYDIEHTIIQDNESSLLVRINTNYLLDYMVLDLFQMLSKYSFRLYANEDCYLIDILK